MFFCIPLLPKNKASDWNRVSTLLNLTLGSLVNQQDRDFEVLICAHDTPETLDTQGLSVSVIRPEWGDEFNNAHRDRRLKKRMLGAEVGRRGGGYLMMLDADDLVSKRLVAHVHSAADPNGHIVETGYALDLGAMTIAPLPGAWPGSFDQYCGSCAVWHAGADDLPRGLDDDRPIFWNEIGTHAKWRANATAFNRPLAAFPFPAAVYLQNTGENLHTKIDDRRKSEAELNIARAAVTLTDAMREEFAIHPVLP